MAAESYKVQLLFWNDMFSHFAFTIIINYIVMIDPNLCEDTNHINFLQ